MLATSLSVSIQSYHNHLEKVLDLVTELERTLITRFNMEQLLTLCFDLGVDYYDSVDRFDKSTLVKTLIEIASSREELPQLMGAVLFPDRVGTDRYEVFLRRRLAERMNLESLEILCFDLGINWEHLSGDSLDAKSRELLLYMRRRARLGELVFTTMNEWPGVLSEDEVWAQIRKVAENRNQTRAWLHTMFEEPLHAVSSADSYDAWRAQAEKSPLDTRLRLILNNAYSEDEFHSLCFELSVDYEDLGGGLLDKERELIQSMRRQARLDELVSYIKNARPDLTELIGEEELDESR